MVASSKKVAIVHDWLIGGGAEKVVEEIHKLYPDAPIYTSYCTDEWRKRLDGKVVNGYLQKWPFSKLRKYLPILMSNWFLSLNLEEFDTIIVSSGNGMANHIRKPFGSKIIFYCHTPTHYLWDKNDEYMNNPGFGIFNPLVRQGLKLFINKLRARDFAGAKQADKIIANSTHTKQQIKKYYQKDSIVIFPPVDVEKFKTNKDVEREAYVIVGRQVPYKRIDLAVKACTKMNLPLTVIGNGPENSKLQSIAGPTVKFLTSASDKEVIQALQTSKAFIFTSQEDFGIAPVEALSAGCPVIAYRSGGAIDYINPNKNGLFFDEQTVSSLSSCLKKFEELNLRSQDISTSANKFSTKNFSENFQKTINN